MDVLECKDQNDNCPSFVNAGYCTHTYVSFMTSNCAKSCKFCGGKFLIDNTMQRVNNVFRIHLDNLRR